MGGQEPSSFLQDQFCNSSKIEEKLGGGRNLVMLSSMIYNIPNLQKKAFKIDEIAFRRP
jgi:hypothetical protein